MAVIQIESQTYEIDAILFDKDGTLLNLNHLWCGWLDAVLGALAAQPMPSVELDKATIYLALGVSGPMLGESPSIDPRGPLAIGSMDDVMSILAQVLYQHYGIGWNDAVRWVQQARSVAESQLDWPNLVKPIGGIQTLIAAAKAARLLMGVVTSDEHSSAIQHLDYLGISQAMSVVIGHDQVSEGKPFPEMIDVACQALGVKPERTLLFGDSNGDMQMAQAAGLLAGIGIAADDSKNHLTAARQVIADYSGCQVLAEN